MAFGSGARIRPQSAHLFAVRTSRAEEVSRESFLAPSPLPAAVGAPCGGTAPAVEPGPDPGEGRDVARPGQAPKGWAQPAAGTVVDDPHTSGGKARIEGRDLPTGTVARVRHVADEPFDGGELLGQERQYLGLVAQPQVPPFPGPEGDRRPTRTPGRRAGRSGGDGSPIHLAKGIPSSAVSPTWLPTRSWTR